MKKSWKGVIMLITRDSAPDALNLMHNPWEILGECMDFPCSSGIFFDLETTGLSKEKSLICLIGIAVIHDGSYTVHQASISCEAEERDLITWFFDRIRHADALIHFYGERFDLPFLRFRASLYPECALRLPELDMPRSVDLYKILKPVGKLLHLSSRKQTDYENYIRQHGIPSSGNISVSPSGRIWPGGRVCTTAMLSFLKTGKSEYLDCVFGHNAEDLCGMTALPDLLSILRLEHEAFEIEEVQDTDDHLLIRVQPERKTTVFFDAELDDIRIYSDDHDLFLLFRKYQDRVRLHYTDFRNYYYLPSEDMAVPRTIGKYLGKDLRRAASPEECYTWIESSLLLSPGTEQAEQFVKMNLKYLFSILNRGQ